MFKKIFIFLETIFFISFIYMDLNKIDSTFIKYLSIILCFIYTLYVKNTYKSVALFFTCVADLFLLVLNKHYEIGVAVFVCAQISYLYCLGNINKKDFQTFLGLRVVVFVVALFILKIINYFTPLNILVMFYFTNLVINCINAFTTDKKLFALGLLLFVCCDICVGLHNINAANHIATLLMWIFYLPSQVLIVIS